MKILYTLVLSLLALNAFAQEEGGAGINISLYAFDYANGHKTVYVMDGEESVEKVRLSTANIEGPYKTKMNDAREVFLRSKGTNEEGEVVYPIIAKVKIPLIVKDPLLVMVPAKGEYVYQALVIDRAVTDFAAGGYKMINFTNTPLRGKVGDARVEVKPRNIVTFTPGGDFGKMIDVRFQHRLTGDWKSFTSTRWQKVKNIRHLLCAYQDPRTQRVKIRGIVIHPYSKAPKKEVVTQ